MSASHSKVVVDHEGDLSSLAETGPLSGLSVPRDWPSSWNGNSGWSCSEQNQSSRLTSQNLENSFHKLISSKESTISTSLIHNTANFPHQKWLWIMEFVELQFRNLLSLLSNHEILLKIHRYYRTHSQRPSCKCRHWNCVSTLFCHLLRKESPTLQPVELILVLFVVRKGEFFDDDLGVNQT